MMPPILGQCIYNGFACWKSSIEVVLTKLRPTGGIWSPTTTSEAQVVKGWGLMLCPEVLPKV